MTSKIHLARNSIDLALKENGVERLRLLKSARDNVDLGIQATVTAQRDQGATWTQIAEQLGVTRQSAQERWGTVRLPY